MTDQPQECEQSDPADQAWAGADFTRAPSASSIALCRSCERRGLCQLGLGREELLPDGTVETSLICSAAHEGGPGVAHGGWIAAAFDEVTGHVPLLSGQLAGTGAMSVSYLKPVPIDRPLIARAWVDRKEERRWFVTGELRLAGTGVLLGRAEATMVLRDPGHFERHRQWLAEQDQLSADPS
jgi:acyl-coenzyme A thioesterase PaaI-like protein